MRDVIIIGSGIAGLSAAVYTCRSDLDTLVIRGDEPGGQLSLSSEVANYPGFVEPKTGAEITERMEEQAEKFGASIVNGVVSSVSRDGDSFVVSEESGEEHECRSVIVASGASARTLGVEGEDEYFGNGVSTCATCDGAFFRGEDVVLVGGGDSAMEEAVFLTKFVDTVYLVHRREGWSAEDYMVNNMKEHSDSIEIMKNTELVEVLGDGEEVTGARLVFHPDGYPTDKLDEADELEVDCKAVFYAIGHTPNTSFLDDLDVETDDNGYILTEGGRGGMQTKTGENGVFAAGDVVDYHYQQAATASGMGVKAAMDVDDYLD